VLAYITAHTSAGGVLLDSSRARINNFVLGLKSAGLWSQMNLIWYPYGDPGSGTGAWFVPIKNNITSFVLTNNNYISGDLSVNGIQGGTGKFTSTGRTAAQLFSQGVLAQAGCGYSFYNRSDIVAASGIAGCFDGSFDLTVYPRFSDNTTYLKNLKAIAGTNNQTTAIIPKITGLISSMRTSSTVCVGYFEGASFATATGTAAAGAPGVDYIIGGSTDTTNTKTGSAYQYSYFDFNTGISAANMPTYTALINGLLGTAQPAYDADANSYFSAIATNNGTILDTTKTAINTLVAGLKSDGIWSGAVEISPFAGTQLNAAVVNLKFARNRVYTNTNFVSGDYTESTGLSCGLTKVLSSAINAGDISASNSMSVGVYLTGVGNPTVGWCSYGVYTSSLTAVTQIGLAEPTANGDLYSRFIYGPVPSDSSGPLRRLSTGVPGFHFGTANTSQGIYYYNGAADANIGSNAPIANTTPAAVLIVGDCNSTSNGTVLGYNFNPPSTTQIRFIIAYNTALSSTQASNLYNRIQTFQTALSRNV